AEGTDALAVTETLATTLSSLLDVLAPLDQVLEQIVTLTANAQPTERDEPENGDLGPGSFTVRALSVALLPGVLDGVELYLATSAVDATADAPAVEVAIDNPTPGQEFTVTPGRLGVDVTFDGTGEPDAEITVTVGGESLTTTVTDEGTWSVTV